MIELKATRLQCTVCHLLIIGSKQDYNIGMYIAGINYKKALKNLLHKLKRLKFACPQDPADFSLENSSIALLLTAFSVSIRQIFLLFPLHIRLCKAFYNRMKR